MLIHHRPTDCAAAKTSRVAILPSLATSPGCLHTQAAAAALLTGGIPDAATMGTRNRRSELADQRISS
jgi:hypothetical protein